MLQVGDSVAYPEMQRHEYDNGPANGAIAAAGTLGIPIPPSAGFAIYAILTGESIGRLFMAVLRLTFPFIMTIRTVVHRRPVMAPQSAKPESMGERMAAPRRASWIMSIIVLTIGGVYSCDFHAVEAAGIGAFVVLVAGFARRSVSWATISEVMVSTPKSTGMVFLILSGVFVFKTFVGFTGVTICRRSGSGSRDFPGCRRWLLSQSASSCSARLRRAPLSWFRPYRWYSRSCNRRV